MNAVVQYQPQPAPQAFTMSELERVALAIAKGRLFGSDDPNAVLTLCMVAQAEGKHPGLVMQQYHIIKGKPAKKAEAMLVDFLAAGGRVKWNRLDDECADATFSHPLGGEVTINWTLARATKAGLLGNDTWKKYPRQMLRSRVVSEGVRTVYPGATSGMYVPEEVEDFAEAPRAATPAAPQPKRARDLKAIAAPEPESQAQPAAEPAHDSETGEIASPHPAQDAADALLIEMKNATTVIDLDRHWREAEDRGDLAAMPDEIYVIVLEEHEKNSERLGRKVRAKAKPEPVE